ncbi:MAG: S8 family serine peptidase [Bacillota bacterium]|nr:S8 family serine peptidase [Bacillota bacterium]
MSQAGGKYNDSDEVSVIVQINDEVMASKHALTVPEIQNLRTDAGLEEQLTYASASQAKLKEALNEKCLDYEVTEHYDTVLNALALKTTFEQAQVVAGLEEVKFVELSRIIPAPILEERDLFNKKDAFSNEMIQVEEAWKAEYTGKKSFIAIIDSGGDPDHEIFQPVTRDDALTQAQIEAIMKEKGIKDGKYFNSKIPFGFNYAERNNEIKERNESSHGMHVAGIIAANAKKENGLKGVAPDAQIAVMRVFGGGLFGGGTTPEIYNKAIDDAVKLGVDSINMSLGSTGRTDSSLEETTKTALRNAQQAGIVVAIAAGNDGFMGFGILDGPDANNPNFGLINSPSVSDISMSVASVDNAKISQKAIQIRDEDDQDLDDNILYEPTDDKMVSEEYLPFVELGMGYEDEYFEKNKAGEIIREKSEPAETETKKSTAEKFLEPIVEEKTNESALSVEEANQEVPAPEKAEPVAEASLTEESSVDSVAEAPATEELAAEDKAEPASEELAVTPEETGAANAEAKDESPAAETEEKADEAVDPLDHEAQLADQEEVQLLDEEALEADLLDTQGKKAKDLTGKYALIMRGERPGHEYTFHDKVKKAQDKGAIGVIIYNNTDDLTLIKMAGLDTDDIKIPSFFISKKDGEFLKEHPNYKIKFSKQDLIVANPTGYFVSNFSSWGMTEEGNFKPDISAPGGKIYSSINNNKYVVMSGTSMATPHVSGGIAIVKEYVEKTFPQIEGEEKHMLIKNILMSTATPHKFADGAYGSPRGQGAGLMTLKRAVNADVVAIGTNGVSSINLGDIKGKTVTVKGELKNFGQESRSFDYYGVLNTDKIEKGHVTLAPKQLRDGKDSKQQITVEAGGTAKFEVSFTLNDPELEALSKSMPNGYFLEGYVFFESEGGNRNVNIPFVGFKGSWGNLSVIEPSIYDMLQKNQKPMYYRFADKVDKPYTYIGSLVDGKTVALGELAESTFADPKFDKTKIAFSPNDDNSGDLIGFWGTFLRNYKDFEIGIFEASDYSHQYPLYKVAGGVHFGSKNYFVPFGGPNLNQTKKTWRWNGKKSNGEAVPEGKYEMLIKVKPDGKDGKAQSYAFPITLDTTFPRIIESSYNSANRTYTLKKVLENGSGIRQSVIVYDERDNEGKLVKKYVKSANGVDGNFVLPTGVELDRATIQISDYAYNTLKLPLNKAMRTGKERSIIVTPSIAGGVITPDKFKYEVQDLTGRVVDQYDLQVGGYVVVITYVDPDYQLTGSNRIPVQIGEAEFDKHVNVEFNRKGKGKATVSVNMVIGQKPRVFLVNKKNGEEFEVVPVKGGQGGAYEGYVTPGDYKIVVRDFDKENYFVTFPLGDTVTVLEGSIGTQDAHKVAKLIEKRLVPVTFTINRNGYQGALDIVLVGLDQDRMQYTVRVDQGKSEVKEKLPSTLDFDIYTRNYEENGFGTKVVKGLFKYDINTRRITLDIVKNFQGEEIPVDKSILAVYINRGESLKEEGYTLESWEAFETVLYEAQQMMENKMAGQTEVNQMVDRLKLALDDLKVKVQGADKAKLKLKIEEAQRIYNGLDDTYTERSKTFLSAAIDGAKLTYMSNEPEKNTARFIQDTIDMLDRAIRSLEKIDGGVNLAPLQVLFDKASEILANRQFYKTEADLSALEDMKQQIEELVAEGDVTIEKMETWINLMQVRLDAIESKANRSKLEAELKISKNINLIKYKLETRKPYRIALQEAKEVMAKKLATQEEIDKAYANLLEKRKLLVKIKDDGQGESPDPQNPQQPEQPQQPQTPGNQDQNSGNSGGGSGSGSGGGGSAPAPNKEKIDETKSPLSKIAKDLLDKANEKLEKLPFADIEEKHWAYNSVKFVYEKELLKGISKDEFMPEGMVSRAMMATILYRLSGEKATGLKTEFKDLEAGSWYEEAVIWCKANKIVDGYNNETFGPNDLISREQMIKMIYAYVKFKDVKIKDGNKELDMSDMDQISPFAKESMEWAISQGIINGMGDGKIHPKDLSNRAQLAVVIEKFVKYLE